MKKGAKEDVDGGRDDERHPGPFDGIDRTAVVLEARCFSDAQVLVKRRHDLLINLPPFFFFHSFPFPSFSFSSFCVAIVRIADQPAEVPKGYHQAVVPDQPGGNLLPERGIGVSFHVLSSLFFFLLSNSHFGSCIVGG